MTNFPHIHPAEPFDRMPGMRPADSVVAVGQAEVGDVREQYRTAVAKESHPE